MNTAINQNHGMGNGIAFLFGAAFNLLANVNLFFLLDYALQCLWAVSSVLLSRSLLMFSVRYGKSIKTE
ncbi:MAG: hypothetical protein IPJ20_19835 [Flammeovirgaceae bacterium]|nr:hypothetical protein [Flammeovirgaceae bacterium]